MTKDGQNASETLHNKGLLLHHLHDTRILVFFLSKENSGNKGPLYIGLKAPCSASKLKQMNVHNS